MFGNRLFFLLILVVMLAALPQFQTMADEPDDHYPYNAINYADNVQLANEALATAAVPTANMGPAPASSQSADDNGVVDLGLPGGTSAYAFRWFNGGPYDILTLDLAVPQSPTTVGFTTRAFFAGDFANDDFSTLHMIDWFTNGYYSVSTTNGAATLVGSSVPAGGHTWAGMSWDYTTSTMYANSGNCNGSNLLYTMNIATGAVTSVAPISPASCIIDIAVSPSGQLYGVDIGFDTLVQINKVTGALTTLGPIGFNADFAQDLDFDDATGTLYFAAYNGSLFRGELRTVNLSTGATTLIGVFGGGGNHEVDGFGIVSVGSTPTPTVTGTPPTSTPTSTATNTPTPTVTNTPNVPFDTLTQDFNNINVLPAIGWSLINRSDPLGLNSWFQGNNTVFPAQSGPPAAYIAANFNSGATNSTISNWLVTPVLNLENGDVIKFWTRCNDGFPPDRLQVRISTNGGSTDVGTSATSVGDFTTLLLDINSTYGGGYPTTWTEYTLTINGLGGVTPGRVAFRYFVENGGPGTNMSEYIGIDTFSYTGPATATPTSTATHTVTSTSVPSTNTPTATGVPPTNTPTATGVPPTNTATVTAVAPTATATSTSSPTATSTTIPPTSTPTTTPTVTLTPTNTTRLLYLPLVQREANGG